MALLPTRTVRKPTYGLRCDVFRAHRERGWTVGIENCGLVLHAEWDRETLDRLLLAQQGSSALPSVVPHCCYWELVAATHIVQIKALRCPGQVSSVCLECALCCGEEVVAEMVRLAGLVSSTCGTSEWVAFHCGATLDLSGPDSFQDLLRLFWDRRNAYARRCGLTAIPPAALRCGDECFIYVDSIRRTSE